MSKTYNNLLKSVDNTFPTDKYKILYIYDEIGKLLFADQWKFPIKLYDTKNKMLCNQLIGYMDLSKVLSLNKEELHNFYNYLFSKSVNFLIKLS